MKRYISILVVFSLLLFSCEENSLNRTIFIPDETNPELPAYTEWGYNSFGAIYERVNIVSTNDIVPCKIVHKDGVLNFSLIGRYNHDKATLTFLFPLSEVKTIEDLAVLHDLVVDLTDNCTVKLESNGLETIFDVLSGHLYFKRFQLLRVDEKINRIILSGVFEVKFLKNGLPETISFGRFDLGITDRDFYSYPN